MTLYALHFDGLHTVETLGLVADDGVDVVNIRGQLASDDRVIGEADPRPMLRNARLLLNTWIAAIPLKTVRDEAEAAATAAKAAAEKAATATKAEPTVANQRAATAAEEARRAAEDAKLPTRDHIFNMVDVTKSYIGGTQRGIVLDLKVGPSWWLSAFDGNFLNKFVSYSRGGKAVTLENQCMGTMQEANVLRCLYAANFDGQVASNLLPDALSDEGNHNKKWFDLITAYHQRAFAATKKGIDVAAPDSRYPVSEIGADNCGPFRVFKPAHEQTNQGATKSAEEIAAAKKRVFTFCSDVYKATTKERKSERDRMAAFTLTGSVQERPFLGKLKVELDNLK